ERPEWALVPREHQFFAQSRVLERHLAGNEPRRSDRELPRRLWCAGEHGNVRASVEGVEVGAHGAEGAAGTGGGGSRNDSPAKMRFGSFTCGFRRRTSAISSFAFASRKSGPNAVRRRAYRDAPGGTVTEGGAAISRAITGGISGCAG